MQTDQTIKVIQAALALAGLALAAVASFWIKIVNWAQDSFFPWMEKNFAPKVAKLTRDAFTVIDQYAAIPLRQMVKAAWQKLRPHLLKMAMSLEKKNSTTWIKRVVSWVIKVLEEPKVTMVETEEEVPWEDLPVEVRNAWMKNNQTNYETDVTEARDRQMETMSMTE